MGFNEWKEGNLIATKEERRVLGLRSQVLWWVGPWPIPEAGSGNLRTPSRLVYVCAVLAEIMQRNERQEDNEKERKNERNEGAYRGNRSDRYK